MHTLHDIIVMMVHTGADILIHTGDFTNSGRVVEYEDFNGECSHAPLLL